MTEEGRFNPLDPLGIWGTVKRDVDRMAGRLRLPAPPHLPGLTTKPGMTIGNPIPVEFNGDLARQKEMARRSLAGKGSEELVDRALKWYEEWMMGLARRIAPADRDLQRQIVQSGYADVASGAGEWMKGIQEAFGISVPA
ncbi:hypothetical protein LCGC14_1350630 [marine sediment metagenome]|uniref:Uncharacterized protein n=1 Tax=marine sediment metagenome TaxID=412755 RepID=A0A0F9KB54_9ZZZZ